jgi:hypothetical protein
VKGIIFAEFLEFAEQVESAAFVDSLIQKTSPASGGAYTAIGTYDYRELVNMVGEWSRQTGIPVPALLQKFGEHAFGRFAAGYPEFFEGIDDAFAFLDTLEDRIHAEVRKLYPDANPPRFDAVRQGKSAMRLHYTSARCLGDFARGLLLGCIDHFGGGIELSLSDKTGKRGDVLFELTLA